MKSVLCFSGLFAFFLLLSFLMACPSPPPEATRPRLSREQFDSIMRADMPRPRVRRSKEQLQGQEEWE
ncbi:MAG: hypothetical protein KDD19_29580 [Phaeodactylibacter sp.]|nr:hypothetical protein [Phaeodactylibacter sp.]MCB9053339.1 hypothetical protein [Lewinellaceae bacterium]